MKTLTCKEALQLLLDQVDFERGACSLTDMVGACIPAGVLGQCRAAVVTPNERQTVLNALFQFARPEGTANTLRDAAISLSDALHAAECQAWEIPDYVDRAWERLSVVIEESHPPQPNTRQEEK